MELTRRVKEKARSLGADLVGIAPVERFINAPPMRRPEDLLPGTKNIVVAAVRYPLQGVLQIGNPTSSALASINCAPQMCEILDFIGYNMTRFLEDEGFTALTTPVTFPGSWRVRPYKDMEKPLQGMFSHRHAAVAAGLGEFGKHSLVLTPEFGPRQRFITILTDADLDPDPMYEGAALCPKECTACIGACKLKCLDKGHMVSCTIGSKTYTYPLLDNVRCAWIEQYRLCQTDGNELYGLTYDKKPPENITYEDIDAALKELVAADRLQYTGPGGITQVFGECIRTCAALFEKRRKGKYSGVNSQGG